MQNNGEETQTQPVALVALPSETLVASGSWCRVRFYIVWSVDDGSYLQSKLLVLSTKKKGDCPGNECTITGVTGDRGNGETANRQETFFVWHGRALKVR